LQGQAVERSPGEAAIIIMVENELPTFAGLTADIRLTGFALGIERREGKVSYSSVPLPMYIKR
jgi:hypothetical protein